MTKEELKNKLKISENTCIHCPTLESAKQVLNIFHQLGLKWCEEKHYIICNSWDNYKEDTIYYPFEGKLSSLKFAHLTGYKIINAEEFIALHTEGEEFVLEKYIPKGDLIGFPKEIIARMLECQEEQGNPRDISVFERNRTAWDIGFIWDKTKEGMDFWDEVIRIKNFDLFFERHPKQDNQDNSQEFKVGDEVIDILTGQRGKILEINTNGNNLLPLYVSFSKGKEPYTLDGRYYPKDKYPRLLHFRDDYNYSIINFNNLPKPQEHKRWRAERNRGYYFVFFNTKDWFFSDESNDDYCPFDDDNYNSGNYFRLEIEAEIIAQKLNSYMKQLIQEEHEHKRI